MVGKEWIYLGSMRHPYFHIGRSMVMVSCLGERDDFIAKLSLLKLSSWSSHTNSFSSSPVSGIPSPITPSLGLGEEGNFDLQFQDNQNTFAHLQDRAWVINPGIHNFDNQLHGTEKLGGWDNFINDDGTEPLSVQYLKL
jgi:hypothetical protein